MEGQDVSVIAERKYLPRGGPDGGNGGKGGDIIFKANPHLKSLINLTRKKTYHCRKWTIWWKQ